MRQLNITLYVAVLIATLAGPAAAYIGPGLGAGAITAILGILAALLMAVIALVWYPVKRLLKRQKPVEKASTDQQ